jgi:hypothetical protein
MTELKSIPIRSPKIVATRTGNEFVLVPVKNNIADMDSLFTLNETGAFIWENIDGNRCVEEIASSLMKEYDVDFDMAVSDVLELINRMKEYLILDAGKSSE